MREAIRMTVHRQQGRQTEAAARRMKAQVRETEAQMEVQTEGLMAHGAEELTIPGTKVGMDPVSYTHLLFGAKVNKPDRPDRQTEMEEEYLSFLERAKGMGPVSYTHLDVYKRQSLPFVYRIDQSEAMR